MFTMESFDLPPKLIKAMHGELSARLFYQKLLDMTADDEDKRIIQHFLRDEKKHYNNFCRIYKKIAGSQPVATEPDNPGFKDYAEGIRRAILDETDAYEFYRDIYMSQCDTFIANIFFEAFTDENEHAIRLNYLLLKTLT